MDFVPCTTKMLPEDERLDAADRAVAINPANRPATERLAGLLEMAPEPQHIAFLTTRFWQGGGVKLTVQFLDNPDAETRRMILSDEIGANAWGKVANVQFVETQGQGQIRLLRDPQQGYYSYLGTDILGIPLNENTMNLASFTAHTPVSEYRRVVKHEFGHCLGAPHEHMRQELVARLDVQKTIAYFGLTQGWSPSMVRAQVLTPLSEASIRGTPHADQDSIMCYQLPGSITIDGQPIRGGVDIDALDGQYAGKLYPLVVQPPPPPPPGGNGVTLAQAQAAVDAAIDGYAASVPLQWLFGPVVQGAKSPADAALSKLWK